VWSLALLSAVALAACGSRVDFIKLNRPPSALHARPADRVELFTMGPPVRPYVELGLIEGHRKSLSREDASETLLAMREEAGRRGCDALVVTGGADVVRSDPFTKDVETLKGYRGTCLVYVTVP
jgi:hypothetical protein